jgi:hypothetical protein
VHASFGQRSRTDPSLASSPGRGTLQRAPTHAGRGRNTGSVHAAWIAAHGISTAARHLKSPRAESAARHRRDRRGILSVSRNQSNRAIAGRRRWVSTNHTVGVHGRTNCTSGRSSAAPLRIHRMVRSWAPTCGTGWRGEAGLPQRPDGGSGGACVVRTTTPDRSLSGIQPRQGHGMPCPHSRRPR